MGVQASKLHQWLSLDESCSIVESLAYRIRLVEHLNNVVVVDARRLSDLDTLLLGSEELSLDLFA